MSFAATVTPLNRKDSIKSVSLVPSKSKYRPTTAVNTNNSSHKKEVEILKKALARAHEENTSLVKEKAQLAKQKDE
jgi:hypothetical protein